VNRFVVSLIATIILIALICVWSLHTGKTPLTLYAVWQGLLGSNPNPDVNLIVRQARLPQLVLSLLVGAGLSAAGLLMQTLCRNPLATPSVLGIGNGANLGLLTALVLMPDLSEPAAVAFSFAGAAGSAGIIALFGLSSESRIDRNRLVIGGTILAAMEASLVIAVLFFSGLNNVMLGWTLGRLVQVDWAQIYLTLPIFVIAIALSFSMIGQLDAFLLGDTIAATLGVRVGLLQLLTMVAVVLLAGAAVAAAGPIPYVGLIVPHIFPRTRFPGPRTRLVLCLCGGALLTGFAQVLSRLSSNGRQLVPLGIWTMATGAIFFFALSLSGRGRQV
jgi:ABC-type Fe3+-siderophore transport system permease subunit